MELRFYINDQLVEHPANARELGINLDFTKQENAELSLTNFDFVNENAKTINDYIEGGLTGASVGILEGLPLRIEIVEGSSVDTLVDGYLDLTKPETQLSCYKINTSIGETASTDWLNGIADSFRFAYLYDQNYIRNSDFINIPYIVSSIPNYKDVLISIISLFVIIKELKSIITKISELVADISGVFTTLPGVVKAVAYMIYAIALVAAIYNLIIAIFDNLIQPIKYHKAMWLTTRGSKKGLINAACEYLDINFSSTLLQLPPYNSLVIIPEKVKKGKIEGEYSEIKLFGITLQKKDNTRTDNTGYFEGTFKDLLIAIKDMFNAKIVMQDNILIFEHELFFEKTSSYVLPDIYNDFNGTNSDDTISNYVIEFAIDTIELNTIDDYQGTLVQSTLTPISINNKKNILLKNLNTVSIPFALGKRKTDFTEVEVIVDKLFEGVEVVMNAVILVANGLIDAANGVISLLEKLEKVLKFFGIKIDLAPEPIPRIEKSEIGKLIDKRIGMLKLSSDMIGIAKIVLIDTGYKISTNNFTYLRAKYLYETYHYTKSFNPTYDHNGQRLTYKLDKIPFCFRDYELVKANNVINLADGREAIIKKLDWMPYRNTASIEYDVRELFTKNLKETIIEKS